jgi:hypothetical protein
LRTSSCHQPSQGRSRLSSREGLDERFKGVLGGWVSLGMAPLRLLRPCYADRNTRNPLPRSGSGLPCYVVTPIVIEI